MENNLIKIEFSYTDELNQESTYKKSLTSDAVFYSGSFEVLFEQFKLFLKASGFDENLVDRITVLDEEDWDDDLDESEEEGELEDLELSENEWSELEKDE